ncbi:hypothetical protein ALC57_12982, partial [Trachymyrmex cornetzi]
FISQVVIRRHPVHDPRLACQVTRLHYTFSQFRRRRRSERRRCAVSRKKSQAVSAKWPSGTKV